jgi:hypothetical protein
LCNFKRSVWLVWIFEFICYTEWFVSDDQFNIVEVRIDESATGGVDKFYSHSGAVMDAVRNPYIAKFVTWISPAFIVKYFIIKFI